MPATGPHIPMLRTLGISLVESTERHAVMTVTVDERHANYLGGAHGGLLATLADTACFFPAPLLPAGLRLATSSLQVNFVRPAVMGDTLTARSELLHLGRRTASLSVRITNAAGQMVAHGTATLIVLHPSPAEQP